MKKEVTQLADERVLILAPTSGDAELSRSILSGAGLECEVFSDIRELCRELDDGAGVVLLTEEPLACNEAACLLEQIQKQPSWSDIPIILLAELGADSALAITTMELLGNVTVLEQPVRVTTLISALRAALKARRRQYELRDRFEAQAFLAAIIESSQDAIISKRLDGTIISWNAAAERLFGYTADEAIGQPITLIIPPERHDEEKAIIERLLRGERIEHFETVRMSKSGRRIDISLMISPVRDDSGRIIAASKVARDITDRKLAERALLESEERFRFLAETIPSIVWTAAPDGTITYVNQRWLEYCGLTPGQNSKNWPELVLHPDDYERCVTAWREALREGKKYEIEVRNRRHDGAYRWFVTRALPLRNGLGQIVSWFGVTTDIHDQKETHERLREMDRRKDDFLATLAHELRNPLAPIRNSVQFMRMAGNDPAASEHAADIIDRQVNHLVRLVDDLLEVSRITRGKIELRKEQVDLEAIVSAAIETSRPLIDAAGHQLDISLPSEPVIFEADAVRVSQVISNLLNNAAKYTEPGGQIWLEARVEGREIAISVRDTGIGIPAEMLPRIFDMFTQVDPSVTRSQGGLGIGLTLSRSLVELHGGTIKARSAGTGRGSEFMVRLPLAQSEQSVGEMEAQMRNADIDPRSPARRILVVDDNIDSIESLGLWLRLMGHDVRLVHEGLAAVEAAREYHPEVIVLDIGLPDIDGYQVARRLRQEPDLGGVLLIALTGYGQDEDRQRCYDAGFDEHLIKPVDPASLEALLADKPSI
ncbi:MAG TPA: PAS domain S-box protein [Blastocatellia bacterium]|nr:PAS domain S-box protein [Blastocatellia bacterium]